MRLYNLHRVKVLLSMPRKERHVCIVKDGSDRSALINPQVLIRRRDAILRGYWISCYIKQHI